jgi:hypothetical protein
MTRQSELIGRVLLERCRALEMKGHSAPDAIKWSRYLVFIAAPDQC